MQLTLRCSNASRSLCILQGRRRVGSARVLLRPEIRHLVWVDSRKQCLQLLVLLLDNVLPFFAVCGPVDFFGVWGWSNRPQLELQIQGWW